MIVTLGQQYHIGEKPTVTLHTHINRHGGAPSKTKTNDRMGLDHSFIFYFVSRIGWVSALSYDHIISHQASYKLTRQETRFCFLIIIR